MKYLGRTSIIHTLQIIGFYGLKETSKNPRDGVGGRTNGRSDGDARARLLLLFGRLRPDVIYFAACRHKHAASLSRLGTGKDPGRDRYTNYSVDFYSTRFFIFTQVVLVRIVHILRIPLRNVLKPTSLLPFPSGSIIDIYVPIRYIPPREH